MKHEVNQVRLMIVEMEWICWTQISKLMKLGYTGTQITFIAENNGDISRNYVLRSWWLILTAFILCIRQLLTMGCPRWASTSSSLYVQSKVTPAAQGQTLKDSIWYKTGLLEENSAEAWGVVCRKGKKDLGRSQLSTGGVNCTLTDRIKKGCRGSIIWGRSSKITGALWSG